MAFPTSPLSQENVLRDVHDPVTQRLRVDTEATIVAGAMEVYISDEDDSIKIGDGNGDYLAINPDGSINAVVNLLPTTTTVVSEYAEVTSVASSILTTVLSFTVISDSFLQKLSFSGSNIATYSVLINGNVADKKRTYFGGSLNGDFNFESGLKVFASDVIELQVIHTRPDVGDFNGRIQVAVI